MTPKEISYRYFQSKGCLEAGPAITAFTFFSNKANCFITRNNIVLNSFKDKLYVLLDGRSAQLKGGEQSPLKICGASPSGSNLVVIEQRKSE